MNLNKMNKSLVYYLKVFRKLVTFWVAEYDIVHLKKIREYEIELTENLIRSLKPDLIVEVGGGAGWQKQYLTSKGYQMRSFDVETTNYKKYQTDGVETYDGIKLPLEDKSIDLIFSSNTLEHVKHLKSVLKDHKRVLKSHGYALHILPSGNWRFWTIITDLIKKFHWSKPHGEFSNNVFQEVNDFSKKSWIKRFEDANFEVIKVIPGRLFYTGNSLFSSSLPILARRRLSFILGSSCQYYLLKNK